MQARWVLEHAGCRSIEDQLSCIVHRHQVDVTSIQDQLSRKEHQLDAIRNHLGMAVQMPISRSASSPQGFVPEVSTIPRIRHFRLVTEIISLRTGEPDRVVNMFVAHTHKACGHGSAGAPSMNTQVNYQL